MSSRSLEFAQSLVKGSQLYEGKAKKIFATSNADYVIIDYKDDATAFNGEKKGSIETKGVLNNAIASRLFEVLRAKGVASHFVAKTSEREMVCRKVSIIPLEVIVRNRAAGSFSKRLGIEEGSALIEPIFEISYKNDALGDPLINDYHAVAIGAASWKDLKKLYAITAKINNILSAFFAERGITLVDFKIEFGKTSDGKIMLADEISPDTCRFWDAATGEKLDKDRFRRDLGNVKEAYMEIFKRIST